MQPPSRTAAALFLGLAVTGGACGAGDAAPGPAPQQAPPNLLLVLADDLGYGDLGAFGNRRADTPHLDRLAAEGARLDAFYAGAPVCSPSRASLFTGLCAHKTGIRQPIQSTRPMNRLRADLRLLPELLRERGYTTALFGKWHLGWEPPDLPQDRGFDAFAGFLLHSRYQIEELFDGGALVPEHGEISALLTERAAAFLDAQAARRDGRPFFLVVAHLAPHAPIEEAAGLVPERVAAARARGLAGADALYQAVVDHLDREVGRLLERLAALGLDQRTLVVFASDNGPPPEGPGNAGPFRGGKWGLAEGGLRVPCIARWPGRIPPGTLIAEPAAMWDLFATFLDAAGAPPCERNGPELVDGRSLLAALASGGRERGAERALVWRHGASAALRRGAWKLVRGEGQGVALYDVVADPGESTDLAPRRPELARELGRELALKLAPNLDGALGGGR